MPLTLTKPTPFCILLESCLNLILNVSSSESINLLDGEMSADNDNKVTRKLTAILSADVKGYCLLMTDKQRESIWKNEPSNCP